MKAVQSSFESSITALLRYLPDSPPQSVSGGCLQSIGIFQKKGTIWYAEKLHVIVLLNVVIAIDTLAWRLEPENLDVGILAFQVLTIKGNSILRTRLL